MEVNCEGRSSSSFKRVYWPRRDCRRVDNYSRLDDSGSIWCWKDYYLCFLVLFVDIQIGFGRLFFFFTGSNLDYRFSGSNDLYWVLLFGLARLRHKDFLSLRFVLCMRMRGFLVILSLLSSVLLTG